MPGQGLTKGADTTRGREFRVSPFSNFYFPRRFKSLMQVYDVFIFVSNYFLSNSYIFLTDYVKPGPFRTENHEIQELFSLRKEILKADWLKSVFRPIIILVYP